MAQNIGEIGKKGGSVDTKAGSVLRFASSVLAYNGNAINAATRYSHETLSLGLEGLYTAKS